MVQCDQQGLVALNHLCPRPRRDLCHGGVINAWAGHVLGIADPFFLDVAYTGISRFLAASTGERSVRSLNETAHVWEG